MKVQIGNPCKKRFYIGSAFIVATLVTNILLYQTEWLGEIPLPVVIGTLVDIFVVIPLIFFMFVLRRKPTLSLLAPFFLLGLLFIHLILPTYAKEYVSFLTTTILIGEAIIVLIEVVAFVMFLRSFPLWKKAFRQAKDTHHHVLARMHQANRETLLRQAWAFPFQKVISVIATDAAAIRYVCFPHLDRAQTGENAFSYHKKTEYVGVFLMLVHAMVIEIIAVHAALAQYSHTVAWVATILDVYALLFLIGDYQAIRKSPIIVDRKSLHIQKGLRFHLTLPLESILSVEKGVEGVRDKQSLSLGLAGFEPSTPDYKLTLKTAQTAYLIFGLKRSVKTIYIKVDDPESFLDTLQAQGVESRIV
ncbi:hypothetical protein H0266_17940 [Halobacillus locisalis]|uniref:Uncharacterized protein n=1 Tax=Halobacillus locisalis TaxID=220753 RepID=A0A838CYD5_9BACI|nr:hypothetical protein [Halobacillus locisalis]MBA2176775.1 hypothetical protein [Halobacillus locisalis]